MSRMPRPTNLISALARRGAEERVNELTTELDTIYKTFPDLRGTRSPRQTFGARAESAAASDDAEPARRGRKAMTAAQRRAVSVRMKKYWASRRKANA